MSIKREEEFECVLIKHLYSGVKKCDCEKLSVGTIADRQHVVRHLKGASVDQGHDLPVLIRGPYIFKRRAM
jgi:ribosomal protein L27